MPRESEVSLAASSVEADPKTSPSAVEILKCIKADLLDFERQAGQEPAADLIPFLKWPGGKRWLVSEYSHLIPAAFNTYIEPFLGSGSVYFHLQPKTALLGDVNPDVIAAFEGVKKRPNMVLKALLEHRQNHSKEYYYQVRSEVPRGLYARAARIIYLNRTCFNGIYRVNRRGEFNVPIGTRGDVVLETDNFPAVSRLLRSAEILSVDFESLIERAGPGDLVFADPPYTVTHNNNGFIKYNETLFSWADQERLAASLERARKRGAKVLATNANHESVRELYYAHGFTLITVSRFSPIAASASSRKQFEELVILHS